MIGKILDLKQVIKARASQYDRNANSFTTTFYATIETIEDGKRYGLNVRLEDYIKLAVGDVIKFDTDESGSELFRFKLHKQI